MKSVEKQQQPVKVKVRSSVLVVFEDAAASAQAVQFCHDLVERFWSQYDFDVVWRSFAELGQNAEQQEATSTASSADLIILASEGNVPQNIKAWLERSLATRSEREGALVDLCVSDEGPSIEKHMYLRAVAHRAGMDYLTMVPQNMSWCGPDSVEACNERAQTVTSVLDEILHRQPAPPHLLTSLH
jgi:hypothetical protein